ALRFKNRTRDDVLRSDQFDFVPLTAKFELDRFGNFGIHLGQTGREQCLHVACWSGARGRRHHSLLAPGTVGADRWESAWSRKVATGFRKRSCAQVNLGLRPAIAYRLPPAKHWAVEDCRPHI